jgi:hypothetical protein
MSRLTELLAEQKRINDSKPVASDSKLKANLRKQERISNAPKQNIYDEHGRDPRRMLVAAAMNAPESALNLGKDLYSAVSSPIKTAKALWETAEATGNKVGRFAAEQIHNDGESLEVMPERSELAANMVGEEMSERYGGAENILRTAIEDPVGLGLDVGGPLGLVKRSAGLIDPMQLVSKGIDKGVTKLAERGYAKNIGISDTIDPDRKAALVKEGMDEGIDASGAGLSKIKAIKTEINDAIQSTINRRGDGSFNVEDINSNLDELMEGYEGTPDGLKNIAMVRARQKQLFEEFPAMENGRPIIDPATITYRTKTNPHTGQETRVRDRSTEQPLLRETISAQEMQKFKTKSYEKAYKLENDPDTSRSDSPDTKTIKQQARASKDLLEDRYDEFAHMNDKWSKQANLKPMVERAIEQFEASDKSLIPYLGDALKDPKYRTKIARAARKAASGDIAFLERTLSSADIRVAIAMSGRNLQTLEGGEFDETPVIPIRNGASY